MAQAKSQRKLASIPLRRGLVLLIGTVCVLLAAVLVGISTAVLNNTLMQQLNAELSETYGRLHMPTSSTGNAPSNAPQGLRGPGLSVGTIVVRSEGSARLSGYYSDTGTYHSLTAKQIAALEKVPRSTNGDANGEFPSPGAQGTDGNEQPLHSDTRGKAGARTGTSIDVPGLGRYLALAGTSQSGDEFIVAMPMQRVLNTVHGFVLLTSGAALALIVFATIIGVLVIRRSLQPLEDLTQTATDVSSLPLDDGPVELHPFVEASRSSTGTEVGDLEASFSRMLGHIERAFAAREASEEKVRRFAVDASHELRTPLASIKGYAELVRRYDKSTDGQLAPDVRQALGRIESEAMRMGRLVEDLLLLARYDAATEIKKRPVDLTALAFDVIADARAADAQSGGAHTWKVKLGDGTEDEPIAIMGEPDRLRQVMVNLLANARVHTPAGTTVVLRLHADAEHVMIEVWDDGPEIPPAFVDRMFERFARADEARASGPHGPSTGLGLSIVAAIVEAHHGSVTVHSAPNDVAFIVTLPR